MDCSAPFTSRFYSSWTLSKWNPRYQGFPCTNHIPADLWYMQIKPCSTFFMHLSMLNTPTGMHSYHMQLLHWTQWSRMHWKIAKAAATNNFICVVIACLWMSVNYKLLILVLLKQGMNCLYFTHSMIRHARLGRHRGRSDCMSTTFVLKLWIAFTSTISVDFDACVISGPGPKKSTV